MTTSSIESVTKLTKFLKDSETNENTEESKQLITILEKLSDNHLVHVHDLLTTLKSSPKEFDFEVLINELDELKVTDNNGRLGNLLTLLQTCHLKALLSCYSQLSKKEYGLPILQEFVDDDKSVCSDGVIEESIKVVRLVKTDEPLGATIAYDCSNENIIVARILHGGLAEREGLIHINDIIVEINGQSTKDQTLEDVTQFLFKFRGSLTLKLIPGETNNNDDFVPIYIRPHFSFDPKSDDLIPCAKAGLAFEAGDVLRVMSKDDASWWQATKVQCGLHLLLNESTHKRFTRAGIIPSITLQTKREKLRRQIEKRKKLNESLSIKGSNMSLINRERRTAWSSIKASFRRKNHPSVTERLKTLQQTAASSTVQPPFFPPYQVVAEIPSPVSTRSYRPIVLVGPAGVGRNELRERLINSNPTLYGVPVPHTSRAKSGKERNGVDYQFVSRSVMEEGVKKKQFLEFGEYKGNLYGTSIEAVKTVTRNHQICVLTPSPQALGILRTKELRPFVIFIKPPSMETDPGEVNQFSPLLQRPRLTLERENLNGLTQFELHHLIVRARQMESQFSQFFDYSLVYDSQPAALEELKSVIHIIQNHSQFVPLEWTDF